jgi:PAS domain S-box-containing protein
MIIVSDADGLIKKTNRAALEVLGYEEKELLAHPVDMVIKESRCAAEDEAFKESNVFEEETCFITKSGETLDVGVMNSMIRGWWGEGRSLVRVGVDLRQIKKLLHDLKEAEKGLQDKKEELEKWSRMAIEREMKIIRLKDEVRKLRV